MRTNSDIGTDIDLRNMKGLSQDSSESPRANAMHPKEQDMFVVGTVEHTKQKVHISVLDNKESLEESTLKMNLN